MLVVYSGTKPDEICDSFLQWGVVERGMIIASTFWNLFTNILLLIKIDTCSVFWNKDLTKFVILFCSGGWWRGVLLVHSGNYLQIYYC